MFRRLLTYQIVVDAVLAAVFLVVALTVEARTVDARTLAGVIGGVIVCAVFAAVVLLRRLAPALALALAWTGGLLQMGLGRQPSFADAAVVVVVYTAAAYGTGVVRRWALASAIAGALIGGVYTFVVLSGPLPQWPVASLLARGAVFVIVAAVTLLLAWTAGSLVRAARRVREGRAARLRAEEDADAEAERVRIARDMHDVVAHSLAVVIAQADGARYAAAADPETTAQALGTIATTARSALADVRVLLAQLRHTHGEGPAPTLADLDALFARTRTAGLDLRVTIDPAAPAEAGAAVQLAVYRILQEALTNALRHGAGDADVTVAWHADHVALAVRNTLSGTPAGADAATRPDGGTPRGHGLVGMRERARLVGGTFTVDAVGDAGAAAFTVRATLPLAPDGADT